MGLPQQRRGPTATEKFTGRSQRNSHETPRVGFVVPKNKQIRAPKTCEQCGEVLELKCGLCFQCLAASFEDSEREVAVLRKTVKHLEDKIEELIEHARWERQFASE